MAPSRVTIIQIMMVSYCLTFFFKFARVENQETLENLEFPVYGLETTEFSDPQTDEGSRQLRPGIQGPFSALFVPTKQVRYGL